MFIFKILTAAGFKILCQPKSWDTCTIWSFFNLNILANAKFITSNKIVWDCRIRRLLFCRGVRPTNEWSGNDAKQSDCEVTVMLELWGIWSTPLLPSLRSLLWPGVVVPHMGQIVLNCVLMLAFTKKPTIYIHTERERDRQTDRQTERETHRERERERERESREIEGDKNTEIDVLYFV